MNKEDFIASNGFKSYDGMNGVFHSPADVCIMLHENNPYTMLKSYGVLNDKQSKCINLDYTGKYIMNSKEAIYLMKRTFEFILDPESGTITIDCNDFGNCPIYSLILYDDENNIIDNSHYSASINIENTNIVVEFKLNDDGFISEYNEDFLAVLNKSRIEKYMEHDIKRCINTCILGNIDITFNNSKKGNIKVHIEAYDLLRYSGMLSSAWCYK